MGTSEIDLNALATGLSAVEVAEVADFIAWKKSRRDHLAPSVLAWHAHLPAEDEPISPDEEEAARVARHETGAIPWEVIKAEFGL